MGGEEEVAEGEFGGTLASRQAMPIRASAEQDGLGDHHLTSKGLTESLVA